MTALISRFGVLAVFALMVPESACIPVPSELTLLFSGLAVHQGWMSFPLAVTAATAGNVVGSLIAYGIGAGSLLTRIPAAGAIVDRWSITLERHGARAVFIARLMPLARTFVALPAGTRHLQLAPFLVSTALGSAIWAGGFIALGDVFAQEWQLLNSIVARVLLVAGIVTLALVTHRTWQRHGGVHTRHGQERRSR